MVGARRGGAGARGGRAFEGAEVYSANFLDTRTCQRKKAAMRPRLMGMRGGRYGVFHPSGAEEASARAKVRRLSPVIDKRDPM